MASILRLLVLCFVLFGSINAQVPSYVPTNGLVGWWGFNGNANDESGNGNNGIVFGASLTADRFGNNNKAYSFNGSSSYILSNTQSINSNSFSISVWLNTSHTKSEEIGLVVSRKSGNHAYGVFLFDTSLYFQMVTECGKQFLYNTKNQKNNDGNWHHFVSVYDGKEMTAYIDGKAFATISYEKQICIIAPFEFGRDNPYGRYFDGKLDDIGIWNRALSQTEVKTLFTSTISDIVESQNLRLSISPNPTGEADQFLVRFTETPDQDISIELLDILGSVHYSNTIQAGSESCTIPVQGLSSGMYMLRVRMNNEVFIEKVIVN